MTSTRVNLVGLTVDYGYGNVVDGLDLEVQPGSITALLGQSGCGKSTTLRAIAGLVTPTAGGVLFDGTDITRQPPWRRNVGLVFQQHALFPHLNIGENVAYGLRARRIKKAERIRLVAEHLGLVGMADFADRRPNELSGGQAQRVAVARALVCRPSVMLLDEPFSSLDANLRESIRESTIDILSQVGVTTLLVTHDRHEALSMADQVALMSAGRIVEIGGPGDLFSQPHQAYTAAFVGGANVVFGDLRPVADGWRLVVGTTEIPVEASAAGHGRHALVIPRTALTVGPGARQRECVFEAEVRSSYYRGDHRELVVQVPALSDAVLRCVVNGAAASIGTRDRVPVGWDRAGSRLVTVDQAVDQSADRGVGSR